MFKDDKGKSSAMRVYSFLSLLYSFGASSYCIANNSLDGDALVLISMYVLGAFAPKAIKKFAELKVK